jgi:hypothetical protein
LGVSVIKQMKLLFQLSEFVLEVEEKAMVQMLEFAINWF